MRKIESEMVKAIKANRNWRDGQTSTEVVLVTDGQTEVIRIMVKFHATIIAKQLASGEWILNSGGYHTTTTKSRINAVLDGIGSPWRLFQHNFEWALFNHKLDKSIPFVDGMTLPTE